MNSLKLHTIGVYGSSEEEFFNKLKLSSIELFCDIRLRRGVRGSKYSFVNSKRLQKKLEELNILYIHQKDLAPSKEIREIQKKMDIYYKTSKKDRKNLSHEFTEKYKNEVLSKFDTAKFIKNLPENVSKVVFFCVEKEPEACHRSLVVNKIANDINSSINNL